MPTAPSLVRRFLSSAIDAVLFVLIPVIWWHWTEWATYTNTFGRPRPFVVAAAAMAVMPLAVVWIEVVTARSAGKAVARLHVRLGAGGRASLSRRALRGVIKWSPVWLGPAGYVAGELLGSTRPHEIADVAISSLVELAESLPRPLAKITAVLGVAARGMGVGLLALPIVAAGQLLALLPSRRSLVDLVAGTRVA